MSRAARLLALVPAAVAVVAVAAVQALGLAASPQRGVDEAVAVASAGHLLGAGLPLTPLSPAWWQLAAAAGVTGALDGAAGQVEQGRWLVLGATVLASALLGGLARALGLGRTASAAAVVVAGLSPLAVALHRTVSAENLALPWALAALVLLLPAPDPAPDPARDPRPDPDPDHDPDHRLAPRPRRRAGLRLLAGSLLAAVALATSPSVLLLAPVAVLAALARRSDAQRAPTGPPTPPGERRSAPVGTPRAGAAGTPETAGPRRAPGGGRRSAGRTAPPPGRTATAPTTGEPEDAEPGDAEPGDAAPHDAVDAAEPAPGTRAGAHRRGRPRHGAPRPHAPSTAAAAAIGGVLVLAGLLVGLVAADAVSEDLRPAPAGADGIGSSTRGLAAVQTWIALDVVLPVLLVVLAALAVRYRRWRVPALATAVAVVGVVLLRLPASSVVLVLVPGALLVGAAVDAVVAAGTRRAVHQGSRGSARRREGSEVVLPALAGALALVVVAAWAGEVRREGGGDAPVRDAIAWVQQRQDAQPVLADPAAAPDLVAAGVTGVADLGADGALPQVGPAADAVAAAADGEVVWVLVTDAVRAASATSLRTSALLGASGVAETFGEGDGRVELRVLASAVTALAPGGPDGTAGEGSSSPVTDAGGGAGGGADGGAGGASAPTAAAVGVPAAPAAARAIAGNPALELSPEAAEVLADGPVDSRLLSLLATLLSGRSLEVTDLPLAPGQAEGQLRRSIVIAGIDGAPPADDEAAVAALVGELDAQTGAFVVSTDRRADAADPRRDELLVELATP